MRDVPKIIFRRYMARILAPYRTCYPLKVEERRKRGERTNFLNSRVDSVINFPADRAALVGQELPMGISIFFSSLDFPPTLRILSVVSKTRLTNSIIITRSGARGRVLLSLSLLYLRASINFLTKSDIIDRIIGLVNFHFGT